jgi:hypothetical protein
MLYIHVLPLTGSEGHFIETLGLSSTKCIYLGQMSPVDTGELLKAARILFSFCFLTSRVL